MWKNAESKNNFANCCVLFQVPFIDNELFTENGIKGGPQQVDQWANSSTERVDIPAPGRGGGA